MFRDTGTISTEECKYFSSQYSHTVQGGGCLLGAKGKWILGRSGGHRSHGGCDREGPGTQSLYLEVDAPGQGMAPPSQRQSCRSWPQVETVLERDVCRAPELIRVTPAGEHGCHLGPPPQLFPPCSPKPCPPPTWITGRSPGPDLRSNAFFVVPTSSSEPGPLQWPARPQSVQESAEGAEGQEPPVHFFVPLLPLDPRPAGHLRLLKGHQPGPHWTSRRSRPTNTQYSPVSTETQGEDGAFMSVTWATIP